MTVIHCEQSLFCVCSAVILIKFHGDVTIIVTMSRGCGERTRLLRLGLLGGVAFNNGGHPTEPISTPLGHDDCESVLFKNTCNTVTPGL